METLPRLAVVLRRRSTRTLALAAAALSLLVGYAVSVSTSAHAADTLLSQGKPATASSLENANLPASNAVDGNTGSRWSSAYSDPQWLQVDLGATANVSQVTLTWQNAYAVAFQLQVSDNATNWTTIYSTTMGAGGTQNLAVTGAGRYVRMYGTVRHNTYGYSLYEFQVYGSIVGGSTCGTANAALNQPATASSVQSASLPASAAVDGSDSSRWGSAFSDPQWLQVDLGSSKSICQVVIKWQNSYATAFQLQVSDTGASWTTIYSTTTGPGGTQSIDVSGAGRYVRMYGTTRKTTFGYSIFEFIVHTGTSVPPLPGGGDLGPNVTVIEPGTSGAAIQTAADAIFAEMESNQFGTQRRAILFKPGLYSGFNAQIGFYTSIAGLGQNPDDVEFHGDVTVDAGWFKGNATQNFWRSAENFSIYPTNGMRWAVAQAAPFRRVDVHGNLILSPSGNGWASGGYIADSRISGSVGPYSQQQWFTRDSRVGGWVNGVWNMVFSGVQGAPAQSFPNPVYTTIAQSPVTREKPYLYVDANGDYRVFVPSLRTNTSGVTWAGANTPGTSIPWSQFYVAHEGDTAATLNQALAQGLNLFFTPGIYHVDQTINVTRPDTVVLGLGYPTLIPDNGVVPMTVADVDGVRLAGLLFDAGVVNSPVLLKVGPDGATTAHAADPASIQDVFFRIGGAGPGQATTSLVVNSANAIIDHIWAWRADHGAGAGWTSNPADTGLIVNGANVMAYALFVEHYQRYEVVWNGNGGRTIFLQNEMPYDPPSAASWMNGSMVGYAAYKVGASVTTHEAWGLGSYCNFTADPTITAYHAFEAPTLSSVAFHDLLTVSLGGKGNIAHIINDTGAQTPTGTTPSKLVTYPPA